MTALFHLIFCTFAHEIELLGIGWVSLGKWDANANSVPISYVYHERKLYFHSALAGHKVDAIRNCDKASFCVIDKDDVQPEKYTTFFRSVIAFGRIQIIEDENEKLKTARLLGNRYNPNDEESLQKELEHGFARMLMIRFDIEHLTGKVAIELIREQSK